MLFGAEIRICTEDAIGRDWQCGTLQVDMNLPERFDISYVDEWRARQAAGHASQGSFWFWNALLESTMKENFPFGCRLCKPHYLR